MRISILIIILFLSSVVNSQEETTVLFIGNSLTFSNDMPQMVQKIAQSNEKSLFVDTIVKSGKTLKYHSEQKKTYERIRSKKWSFVVIQGHSTEFSRSSETVDLNTIPYLSKLVDSVRENSSCTRVILYETWGYKYGKKDIPNAENFFIMQNQIKEQSIRAANSVSIDICPVGEAWKSLLEKDSTLNLYSADNYHPARNGSYAAACMFYITLFGEAADGNSAKFGISAEQRKTIESGTSSFLIGNQLVWNKSAPLPKTIAGYDLILQNNQLELVNNSINSTSVIWDFGDRITSDDSNPSHTYKKKGKYSVTQTVHGTCSSDSLSRTISVKVLNKKKCRKN